MTTGLANRFIGFGGFAGESIQPQQFGQGLGAQGGFVDFLFPRPGDHAKLRAPIADVVVGNDMVADKASDARQALAENGRADVSDVHGLGDIRRGEVDDNRARLRRGRHSEPGIGRGHFHALGVDLGLDAEIDETRAGDFHRGNGIARPGSDHLFGQCARVHLVSLRQHHGGVRLVIAEAQVIRRSDVGRGGSAQNVGESGGERGFELLRKSHGRK